MDNIIVINGHVSRLETRLSDSPWEDAGSRGSCYDQPGMPVPPVLNICSYPAVAPEAPSEAAPDAAPELDIRPYPAMAPEAPAADTASEATMEATPGPRSADPALDMLPSPAITPETVLEAPSSSPDANGESEENDRNSKGQSSRHYRTAKRARAITRIAKVPDIMAVPSLGEYKDAMTILTSTDPLTMKKRPAWLNLVLPEMVTHLTYKNDELLYDGVQMPNIDLVNYLDMTPARVSQTDTVLLRALYATMLLEIEEDLSGLSPEEILARDTAIFRGTVRALRYYVVAGGGCETQYTAAEVEVTDRIRGDVLPGELRTVLYPGGPDMSTSLSGPLEDLEVGSEAVFMPERTSEETGERNGASWFCYADLADFYLSEGLRFVFLDTGEGLEFERGVYEDIADAETLEEVMGYLRGMTGAEETRPAAVPAEPQETPSDTAEGDPAAASGPAGAREQPGGALAGDE